MDYVVIGNGVAGTKGAEAIRRLDPDGSICMLTDEEYPFYSRIRLMDYLAGEVGEEDLVLRRPDWYRDRGIELFLETPVREIDVTAREIVNGAGGKLRYDRLLLATGGIPFVPPIPGADRAGVFTLRTLEDAKTIRGWALGGDRRVVMIGGGVLGLEAGNGLRKAGCSVAVVEFFPRLLPRQMDAAGAAILQDEMEGMGFSFHLGSTTREIRGGPDGVTAVVLDDGTRLGCDTVVISAGVRPNGKLAASIGLEVDKGVPVNDRMATALPRIFAAGDLVQHRERFYGIWPAAEEQGKVAGTNMAGGDAVYEGTTVANALKVAGIDLFAIGNIDADGGSDCAVFADRERHIYKKCVFEGDRMTGAILYGDIGDRLRITACIKEEETVSPTARELLKKGDFSGL